jgi:hypothetical protein
LEIVEFGKSTILANRGVLRIEDYDGAQTGYSSRKILSGKHNRQTGQILPAGDPGANPNSAHKIGQRKQFFQRKHGN